jgi:hypothetical protein
MTYDGKSIPPGARSHKRGLAGAMPMGSLRGIGCGLLAAAAVCLAGCGRTSKEDLGQSSADTVLVYYEQRGQGIHIRLRGESCRHFLAKLATLTEVVPRPSRAPRMGLQMRVYVFQKERASRCFYVAPQHIGDEPIGMESRQQLIAVLNSHGEGLGEEEFNGLIKDVEPAAGSQRRFYRR